jgi:hypothetical protein
MSQDTQINSRLLRSKAIKKNRSPPKIINQGNTVVLKAEPK